LRVLLATGFSNIERELQDILTSRGDECWRCYHRQAVVPAAEEYSAEVVVLSPALEGNSDLVETVILPLRQKGIRIIFLPGGVDMPDTKKWLKRLVPYGIYCYVFDPVSPKKVIQRIEKPGSLGDIPVAIRESAREVSVNISAPLDEAFEEAGLMLEGRKPRKRREDVRSVFSLFGESDAESKVINRVLNPATLAESGVEPEGEAHEMDAGKSENKVPFWRRLFRKKGTPGNSPAGTITDGKLESASLETVSGKEQVKSRDNSGDSGTGTVFGGHEAVPARRDHGKPGLFNVLLVGDRAKELAPGVIARGWKVAGNSPAVPPDVAVVDAELLPSVLGDMHCPVIAFSSGRLSEWFSLADSGVPVACGSDACLALAAGFLGSGHHREVKPVGSEGESSPALPAVSTPSHRRGFVIAFYSGAQGYQGKTVLALNTAVLLAEKGLSVCLADLDTDKAGLTALCGFSEDNPPPVDLIGCVSGALPAEGPAGVKLVPAPVRNPGWFPDPRQAGMLVAGLAAEYDAVVLDFGARIASPAVVAALKSCDRVFLVSTPLRSALTAVARFRGRGLADVGGEKVTAVINRVGVRGGISPRDAARLLGVDGQFFEVPEDPAVVRAENEALEGGMYNPPVLKKKSLIRPALMVLLDRACRKKKEVELC
jgi:MinD-like ATPase involved in chromosome partitioning or flagellar assembly